MKNIPSPVPTPLPGWRRCGEGQGAACSLTVRQRFASLGKNEWTLGKLSPKLAVYQSAPVLLPRGLP